MSPAAKPRKTAPPSGAAAADDSGPFLGRVAELRAWQSILSDRTRADRARRDSFVVVVHGIGGMGKTTLVRRFRDVAESSSAAHGVRPRHAAQSVLIDLEQERERMPDRYPPLEGPSVGTLLYTIERAVCETVGGNAERAFADFRAVLAQLINLVTDSDRVQIAADQPGAALTDEERRGLANVGALVAGLLGVSVSPPVLTAGAAAGGTIVRTLQRIARRADRPRDPDTPAIPQRHIDLALDAERVLVRSFAAGLYEVTRRSNLVVAIDTGEIATRALAAVRDAASETGAGLTWLIAGRFDTPSDSGYFDSTVGKFEREISHDRLAVIAISAFDRELQRQYLESRLGGGRFTDRDLHKVDLATRGIPLGLALVVEMIRDGVSLDVLDEVIAQHGDANTLIQGLAERFLYHALRQPAARANALRDDLPAIFALIADETVEVSNIVGYELHRRILAALLNVEAAELSSRLDRLAERHDFVLAATGRVHEEVAGVIRQYMLGATQRLACAPMHHRALNVLTEELSRLFADQGVGDRMRSEVWRLLAAAVVRHEFWLSNEHGIAVLAEVLPSAAVLNPGFARVLHGIAQQFYPSATQDEQSTLRGFPWPDASPVFLARRAGQVMPLEAIPAANERDHKRASHTLSRQTFSHVLSTDGETAAALHELLEADRAPRDGERVVAQLHRADARARFDDDALNDAIAQRASRVADALIFSPSGFARGSDVGLSAAHLSVKRGPRNATAQWRYAIALREAGRYDEALAAHEESLRLDPGSPFAFRSYATTVLETHDDDRAASVLERGLADHPNDGPLLSTYAAFLLTHRHDDAGAAEMLSRARAANPSNWFTLKYYVRLLRRTDAESTRLDGAITSAKAALERALAASRGDSRLHDTYALFLTDDCRDDDGAEEQFQRAIALDPSDADALANYSRLLFERGDDEAALALADRALAAANAGQDDVKLEVWFYLFAAGPPDRRSAALAEITRLVRAGVRSRGWNFERITARARTEQRADVEWLERLSDVISEDASTATLAGWTAWVRGADIV